MRKFFESNRSNPWFWAFIVIAAVLLVAMPLMSRSAGNSGDEDKFQIPQGRFVMDYFHSDGTDTTCMKDVVTLNGKEQSWNLKYYGCSFDVVTEWLNETLGIEDIAKTRHICNALMGWLIVLFGGLIAWRIGGWRAGVYAMLLLFFSPRLLGHTWNNPKDIPLAAGVIMSIYYIMMFFRQMTPQPIGDGDGKGKKAMPKVEYTPLPFGDKFVRIADIEAIVFYVLKNTPKFNPLTLLMLALSLAIAVSNRIGGLIVVGYMGLWGLLWLIRNGKRVGAATVGKTILTAIAVCAIGFFAGLLLWPYALQNPVHNSIESFRLMSQFDVQLRQLFEGSMVMSSQLPWYYTPKFMLMTIPLAVMLGWVMYPIVGWLASKLKGEAEKDSKCPNSLIDSIMVYFCFLFPVTWIVITGANVYGGWRHSLFAYAPMAVAAGLGYSTLVELFDDKKDKAWAKICGIVAAILPLLLMIGPASYTLRNHPYEYTYFNKMSGGVEKAFGNYEIDYYYHSMREATEWVMANAEPRADGEKTLIGSWHVESTRYFMRHDTTHFSTRFVRWGQRYEYDWDYMVFPLTGISGDYLKSKQFPPADCVHQVTVDGVPVALILKRQTKDDLAAVQLLRAGNADSAKYLFEKVLAVNPYNETALSNLANISLQRGENDKAESYADKLLEVDPTSPQALQMKVYALLGKGRQDDAIALLRKAKSGGNDAFPYSMTAQIMAQHGDLASAFNEIGAMLDKGLMDQDALNIYVQMRMQQGADQQSAIMSFYTALANGLEKNGNKKQAEELRTQLRGGK